MSRLCLFLATTIRGSSRSKERNFCKEKNMTRTANAKQALRFYKKRNSSPQGRDDSCKRSIGILRREIAMPRKARSHKKRSAQHSGGRPRRLAVSLKESEISIETATAVSVDACRQRNYGLKDSKFIKDYLSGEVAVPISST